MKESFPVSFIGNGIGCINYLNAKKRSLGKVEHLTVNRVYWPLANSHGHILKLIRAEWATCGKERSKRLHQFLSAVGVKALRQHLGQLPGIAQVPRDQAE